jgi:ArsR family transcriptional regulator, arsenate/arsenite/antimonite-responsive transcriptional repressor
MRARPLKYDIGDCMFPCRLDEMLKAAGDPTRLRLLNLLRLGNICVCDLQAVLRIPQTMASRHLAALRHAGLVSYQRKGMRIVYSRTPAATTQVAALHDLLDRCCPEDAVMRDDVVRFRKAVADGTCRLEIPSNGAAPVGGQLQEQGSPA